MTPADWPLILAILLVAWTAGMALLAQGYTSTMVAKELGISSQTVKNYCASVFKKLDVCNRYGAFFELGWLKPPMVEGVLDSGTMSDN